MQAANERKTSKYSDLAAELLQGGRLDYHHLPLKYAVRASSAHQHYSCFGMWAYQGRSSKEPQKQLLAMAEAEWQELGVHTTRKGSCRGWQGDVPAIAPPPGDVSELKERNIDKWWSPADDPVADPWRRVEAGQAEMSSR